MARCLRLFFCTWLSLSHVCWQVLSPGAEMIQYSVEAIADDNWDYNKEGEEDLRAKLVEFPQFDRQQLARVADENHKVCYILKIYHVTLKKAKIYILNVYTVLLIAKSKLEDITFPISNAHEIEWVLS